MRMLAVALLVGLSGSFVYESETPQTSGAGVVVGRVVSENGAAIAGANVELLRDGIVKYTAVTSADGEFRFTDVTAGTYLVRAAHQNFAPNSHPTVVVGERAPRPLTIMMRAARAEIRSGAPAKAARDQAQAGALPSIAESVLIPGAPAAPHVAGIAGGSRPSFNTETYDRIDDNRFRRATTDPVSTFSIDVDTASYSNVRRFLGEGRLPPADAVRSEELINYFRFSYPDPKSSAPFSVTTEVVPCPWNPRNRLALIGLQARKLQHEETPARNLVFLLDVSGSMLPPNKLPLVKAAMKMLTDTLRAEDRVAIVVYAGASGLALPSTPGNHKPVIQNAIEVLQAGGSTNGASGIRLAYNVAADNYIKGGVNRVILATDGDFNVGVTSQGELVRLIEEQRERGIFLSVIGVGTGNLKDSTMEKLADKGNGNYSYFDTLHEARRVLIAEGGATLVTVAKDVKIQVEFNPARVGAYRLIGYENRLLNREDFNDDRKDAGEIGAGHTVTALYEIVPPGERIDVPTVDPLKYQDESRPASTRASDEIMTVKLRYKQPDGERSELMTIPVTDRTSAMSENIGFAAAVAEFGMLLRRSEFVGKATWESARALAVRNRGADVDGYRAEFIRLLDLAAALDRRSDGDGNR
jgi:Ca-activated chloride channel family protein